MNRALYIKATFAFAIVFISGALSGMMVKDVTDATEERKVPCKVTLSERMTAYLARELELSDMQVKQIAPFVDDTCALLEGIHKEAVSSASEAIEICHHEILPFLTAEQVKKLNQCETKRKEILELESGYQLQSSAECSH